MEFFSEANYNEPFPKYVSYLRDNTGYQCSVTDSIGRPLVDRNVILNIFMIAGSLSKKDRQDGHYQEHFARGPGGYQ